MVSESTEPVGTPGEPAGPRRPAGLVVLAVVNFLVGGYNLLRALGLSAMLMTGDRLLEEATPEEREILALFLDRPAAVATLAILYLAQAGLLIASGIGYLKLERFLGRALGNTYAVVGILGAFVVAFALPAAAGGGFTVGTLIEILYPVITLLALNLVFREHLVR